jgi:hypothetical protein
MYDNKPLIIWQDEEDKTITTFSEYEIKDCMISFTTKDNKITIPINKIIKIKEVRE